MYVSMTRDLVVLTLTTAVVVATCCPAVRNRAMRDNTQKKPWENGGGGNH